MNHLLVISISLRAAQYLRMSTEHQRYSTQNQAGAVAEYADRTCALAEAHHGMAPVASHTASGVVL
jgi:hypothetical protein